MPIYSFVDDTDGREWTEEMSMAEREVFLEGNPKVRQLILKAPMYGDPVRMGVKKPDPGFIDRLKHIKRSNPGSIMNAPD